MHGLRARIRPAKRWEPICSHPREGTRLPTEGTGIPASSLPGVPVTQQSFPQCIHKGRPHGVVGPAFMYASEEEIFLFELAEVWCGRARRNPFQRIVSKGRAGPGRGDNPFSLAKNGLLCNLLSPAAIGAAGVDVPLKQHGRSPCLLNVCVYYSRLSLSFPLFFGGSAERTPLLRQTVQTSLDGTNRGARTPKAVPWQGRKGAGRHLPAS